MADARRPGEKARGPLREVFGEMPLPEDLLEFDEDYEEYWRQRQRERVITEPARRRARGVERFINEGDSVLDVGCGTGETLEYLRKARGIRGTGLDISTTALESVSEMGFDVLRLDLTETDVILEGTWDHIILFEVAEHVVNAEMLLAKLRGHYRRGLYVTTPNLGYIAHRLRLLFGRFPVTYISDPREHVRYWTVRDFRYWAGKLGYPRPSVIGLRGKGGPLPRKWPSLWASEVVYRMGTVG